MVLGHIFQIKMADTGEEHVGQGAQVCYQSAAHPLVYGYTSLALVLVQITALCIRQQGQ